MSVLATDPRPRPLSPVSLAQDRTLSFAPDEPVVLFRDRNHGAPQNPADPSAEPGITIWIEQAAPAPTP